LSIIRHAIDVHLGADVAPQTYGSVWFTGGSQGIAEDYIHRRAYAKAAAQTRCRCRSISSIENVY